MSFSFARSLFSTSCPPEKFEIVDKEYKKMEAKDVHGRLAIGFREKNGDEYTFDDVKSSLEKINLKSIKRIDLWFYEGKDKDVNH